jgi:peptidoglycan/LPS O-acetylase OafA/YrhL
LTTQSEESLRLPAPTYRADIDGLRALAVIPVVLFHARVSGFGGGFVGVDVFFVISGFLITGLISHEVDRRVFSYFSFWERRARRLLPPMIIVVAATYVAAYQILFPEELKDLGKAMVAISVFASNIQFWRTAGYFGAPSEMSPLLHTWSLAVEEQFYFLFPAVLVGLSFTPLMRRIGVVSAIGVASFALSVWWVAVSPTGAYFLLMSRAWELMLGAGIALMPSAKTLSRLTTNALLLMGLVLIALSVCLYTEDTPFPGIAALVPCVGTALIIWTGQQRHGAVKRLFDNAPMVFVGKLSYSIYLWHWPLLVLFAAWAHKPLELLTPLEVVVIVAATIALSWLSLTLIENPIRRKHVCASRRSIFFAAGTAMAVLAAFGLGAYHFGGYPRRIPADVRLIADGVRDRAAYSWNCKDKSPADVDAGRLCRMGGRDELNQEPRFLLWGDSHAHALFPVVDEVAKEFGVTGLHASHSSCPPVPDVDVPEAKWGGGCRAFNDSVLRLIDRAHLDAVFLAAFWSAYEGEGELRYADGRDAKRSLAPILDLQLSALIAGLNARGVAVFVFEEVPYVEDYYPARFAQAVWRGADPASAGISIRDYRNRNAQFSTFLDSLSDLKLHRISPVPGLCSDGSFCPAVTEGQSNFRDTHHLSVHGASQLAPAFRDAFSRVDWTASSDRN